MSRIATKFLELKKQGRKALITFITAGDPSLRDTEKLIGVLESAGADIIELGIPFSDPIADGPVIQAASERALKKGVTVGKILKLVARVRRRSQIPILLMGYYNPVCQMGHQRFAIKAAGSGVDALLMVDLPPEEAHDYRAVMKKNRLDTVFLLAPTSNPERIKKVLKFSSGFVYYVSLTGVTGAQLKVSDQLRSQITSIRQKTLLPVAVGFGISKPMDARKISLIASGIVVGSALVKMIHKYPHFKDKALHLHRFVHLLRRELDKSK